VICEPNGTKAHGDPRRTRRQARTLLLALGATAMALAAPTLASGEVQPAWRLVDSPHPARDSFVTPFSVKDFGARGDGRTDDTAAFQRGLDRAKEIGGGSLHVPAGRYAIRGRLRIPIGVTLRGIWRNPREGGEAAGSILMLYAGRGTADGEPTLGVEKCAGLRELTLWYPEQKADAIEPYPFAVKQLGGDNATVENVTFVNAYQAIQIGPGSNELHFIRHVYGTPLKTGIWYDSTTDIGRILHVHFSPDYWSRSGLPGAPPADGPHRAWLLKNGTGLHMGRSDWEYGAFIRVDGYGTGMRISKGERGAPNAQFYGLAFRDCAVGIRVADSNPYGLAFTRCTFSARELAVHLERDFRFIVLFNGCTLAGRTLMRHEGTGAASFQGCTLDGGAVAVQRGSLTVADCASSRPARFEIGRETRAGALVGNRFPAGLQLTGAGKDAVAVDTSDARFKPLPAYPERRERRLAPRREHLYVVDDPRWGAKPGDRADDTAAVQKALDAAGREGGGTVFVPGGDYVIRGTLRVPSGVELKGVYDVPHHTLGGGSVLHVYGGRGKAEGSATVTLEPDAGLVGLSFYYPEQGLEPVVPYPFLIAGRGRGVYVVNVNAANAYQFLDLLSRRCDGHTVDYLSGAPLKIGVRVGGGSRDGVVANTQFNPHYWGRTPKGPWYANKPKGGTQSGTGKLLWEYQKENLDALLFGHCMNELQFENFVYGSLYGIHFVREGSGSAEGGFILGHGTDGSKISALFEAAGAGGLHLVNTELVCMASRDKEYIRCSREVRGDVVLHNTLLWGQPDRSGTIAGGNLVLQQATFTRYGRGFDVKGGSLSLVNVHYLKHDKRGNHLTLGGNGQAEIAACNFPGPLMVNGKPAGPGAKVPRLTLRKNAHR
jgi:hypothetical protein